MQAILPATQQLSVILPAYQEEQIIAETIQSITVALQEWELDYEIVVINDGSTDETETIITALAAGDPHIIAVNHPTNRGYGAALASGFAAATKPYVFFMDSDGQFSIWDLAPFFPLLDHYDAVLGYRIGRSDAPHRRLNAWGWKMIVWLMLGVRVRDLDCAFKVLPAAVVQQPPLASRGALVNAEIVYRLKHGGWTYTQTGVRHFPRQGGKATGARIGVILRAFRELWRYGRKWREATQPQPTPDGGDAMPAGPHNNAHRPARTPALTPQSRHSGASFLAAIWKPTVMLSIIAVVMTALVIGSVAVTHAQFSLAPLAAPPGDDWPMFLHDVGHSAASYDNALSPAAINQLTRQWIFPTDQQRAQFDKQKTPIGPFAASPAVVGDTVYIGSWDGYEYALDRQQGYLKWKTYLGLSYNPHCQPPVIGVTSSAAVVNNVVYVGGGDAYWYALDARTGAILWKVYTGDTSDRADGKGGHYNWASPLIAGNFAYVGISSNCDAPLVQGQLLKIDLTTHQIAKTLDIVKAGQVGGGIWTSPAIDLATQTIYATTGTINESTQIDAQAMLAIDANTMQIKTAWQVPSDQTGQDSDWGNSPTLMTGSKGSPMVAAINKNGFLYAFDRNNIGAGPKWERQIALGGPCPACGEGSIVSSVFADGTLYVGGGNTVIGNQGYAGAVRAIDPDNGTVLWEHGTLQPVYPSLAYTNGLIIDGAGFTMEILDAHTGRRLYDYEAGGPIYGAPSVAHGQIFLPSTDGTIMAFGLGDAPRVPADGHCPQGWICQDINTPDIDGAESANGATWRVSGSGYGIGGVADQFRFDAQKITGDFALLAQITSVQGGHSQAGLMVRQSADPGSPYYAALLDADNVFVVQYRTGLRGATTISGRVPAKDDRYVVVERVGDRFQAATSSDGVYYTLIPGSTISIAMPATSEAGLAVSSTDPSASARATFQHVARNAANITLGSPASADPCPANWNCQDDGNPALIGDQTLNNGTWSIQGAGDDIWNASDEFHFVWQPITQDGTVTAHITSQSVTQTLAKAGIMIRQGDDAGAPYYGVFVTPKGLVVQYRSTVGLKTYIVNDPDPETAADTEKTLAAITVPIYLRVARWNNILTAYTSPDGQHWTPVVNSSTAMNFTGAVAGGLAVTSHDVATLDSATFDTVSVTQTADPAPTACPDGWQCDDIGNPIPIGSQQVNGGTWTLQSGGIEIYHFHDSFHFVAQPINGDVTISARIIRMDYDPNVPDAQAGLMMRDGTNPIAPYYGVFLTPNHGIHVQYRLAAGADTGEAVVPSAGPIFLRIVRGGAIYSAYYSHDGAAWNLVPGSVVDLGNDNPILVGMAISSHNEGTISVVTIDSLNIQ